MKRRGVRSSGARVEVQNITFSLSLMDPFPRMDILVRVSSCRRFNEFPRGPRSLPTKLNYKGKHKKGRDQWHAGQV